MAFNPSDLNEKDEHGMTPYLRACMERDFNRMQMLESLGADIKLTDAYENTTLHLITNCDKDIAIEHRKEIIQLLLQNDINAKNNIGNTPLFMAIFKNHMEFVNLLIEQGGDLTIANNDKQTALHAACANDNEEMIEVLLQKSPELLDVQSSDGYTPFLIAIEDGHLKCAHLLIAKGTDLTIVNNLKQTSLKIACHIGNKEMVELLLQKVPTLINFQDNDGFTPLHAAIGNNHIECAKLLIAKGADTTIVDNGKKYLLHIASSKGCKEILELLLQKNPDLIDAQDRDGYTPLLMAIIAGHVECAKLLIAKGSDVTIVDDNKRTLLHHACLSCNKYIVNFLLQNKSDLIDAQDSHGYTPLIIAIISEAVECAKLLIAKGADVTVRDKFKRTPLHVAIDTNQVEIAKLLIDKGLGLDAKDDLNQTPLHVAIDKGQIEIAKLLIEKGFGLDVENNFNDTSLHIAIRKGHLELATLLIEKRVLLNIQNCSGDTPFHIAISKDYTELATFLIENGARLDLQDRYNGYTPLYLSISRGLIELAKHIIEKKIGLALQDQFFNYTPLHLAISRGLIELAKLLIENEAGLDVESLSGETPLHMAINRDYTELVELIIRKGIGLDFRNMYGNTPLHIAIAKGKVELAKLFIEKMAGIDVKNCDRNTPLHFAVSKGETELAKLLIEHGVELSVQNNNGYAPLHFAIVKNNHELAKLLIEKGAELSLQNENGNTAFHCALYEGNQESAKFIVEKIIAMGANASSIFNIPNKDGLTPLHIACGEGFENIVELLVKNGASLNGLDKNGNTALMCALGNRKIVCALLLIKNEANVNIANSSGTTALHIASELDDDEVIVQLMNKGANLYAVDLDRNSPITHIVSRPSKEVPNILKLIDDLLKSREKKFLESQGMQVDGSLLKGIEYNKVPLNQNGDTLVHIACRYGKGKLVQFLIDRGMTVTDKNIYAETPFTIALYQVILLDKQLDRLIKERLELLNSGPGPFPHHIEKFKSLNAEIQNTEKLLKELLPLMSDIIEVIFERYVSNSKDVVRDSFGNASKFKEFEKFIISMVPQLISNVKEGVNILDLAFALNSPLIARAIAKELGKKGFDECFAKLSNAINKSFKESIVYDIDDAHLVHNVECIPEKPIEEEYQLDAVLSMFDELSGYDSANPEKYCPLESKFRKYLIDADKRLPFQQLRERMRGFIDSCKARGRRTGIPEGQEVQFWERVEKAITNTVRDLKTSKETNEEIYEKKSRVIREYLDLMSYCATKLDVELDKIYYENSGIIRGFSDEIYFQLAMRRRLTLESLAPMHSQSVHTIQIMLKNLGRKYNIPIKQNDDLFSAKLAVLDLETSFRKKYQDWLIDDIKNHLKSNKDIQNTFFQMLEENGLGKKLLLPLVQTKDFFKKMQEYLKLHNDEFSEEIPNTIPDVFSNGIVVPNLREDLYEVSKMFEGHDFEKLETVNYVLSSYFDVNTWKLSAFETIAKAGAASFKNLDFSLKRAIDESGMTGNLSLFQSKDSEKIKEVKQKILDKYIENNFPMMIKQVKDENVIFLLKKFGVLKVAYDALV